MQDNFLKNEYKPKDSYEKMSDFYAGVGNIKRKKTVGLRIALIIFCFFCLLLPGVFFLLVSGAAYVEAGIINMMMPLVFGLVMISGGISGLWSNIFYKDNK